MREGLVMKRARVCKRELELTRIEYLRGDERETA